ncbi:MAG: branched-chain amino acid ABC transporter substrate-binding protein [Hyphomicrobium sp.]|nr:branched-chain amino acid ABC transporter substrate-binding protein [Hyphomicrobium sp.]
MSHTPPRLAARVIAETRRLALALLVLAPFAQTADAGIIVAVAGPATGPASQLTDATLDGARRAADTVNSAGGLNGEQLIVERHDDGCDAAKASTLATSLAARKIALVLGHPCTATALSASKIYAGNSIIFIATASRHGSLTTPRPGPSIFRLSGRDDKQGEDAGQYLVNSFVGEKIAIVHDRTRYARVIAEQAAAAHAKAKALVPITATLIASEKDFPLVTAKIKDAKAIFYAGFPLEAGMLHAQLRAAGSKAVFLMSDSNATDEFASTFGASAAGVRVMRPQFALDDAGQIADAAQRAQIAAANLAGGAVEMFAAAAREAASNDPQKIAGLLSARPNVTRAGTFDFDSNGDAKRPSFSVYTWTPALSGPATNEMGAQRVRAK